MIASLVSLLGKLSLYGSCFVLSLYFVPQILLATLCRTQDLKKKYGATWALVTGGSSGIGKSLAWKLAGQGLNVAVVALDDKLLADTVDELRSAFPNCEFLSVGANLGTPGYLSVIQKATDKLPISLVFCNAGYMVTGFFNKTPLETQMANMECNATSAVQITHHFVSKMVEQKLRGCLVYTSSAAAMMPSPFTVLYAATKSFISSFAASLAAEVKHHGIDVCVVHPSPVATRFYENQKQIDLLDFFKGLSVSPDELPDVIFGSIGRTVWRDVGGTAIAFRTMMKFIDYNFLATLLSNIAHLLPDFKRHNVRK
mmetsp:Transcript_19768/g.35309  ORF Transcript_19768/g.35309 Transcript_19768/m.35309 type:complete len:313 (-) Transcript_19768:225-1163(-)